MRLLGAILAGGESRRFGSDKALALHTGKPLIAHVAGALKAQCEAVVVCGRAWGGMVSLADAPAPGLGPLGGLCAALQHGQTNDFDAVLCAPCDLLGLPVDAALTLTPGPAVAEDMWLVGLWPAILADILSLTLSAEGAIPARRWVELAGASVVPLAGLRNINRPEDLAGQ
ncbi:molybdenum cofactor guanylyltransferase [Sandaracinobacteroides hominis]|uniref:molybdenum cofactor guanylyltransferase n=1 Tax=Sandaracinobacteroides hominis TaxID=2780086 RepID=UPI0018F75B73|nr:molybdenum cofactor guanylyltransferase [Sandaracinobacteroides hominis]